ncbi:MAG: acyl-CoA dehydrogenase family protein, partial [Actinomycetota bacterium]
GQKVWTSGAHKASFGILIARTNPEVPKHRGITYFAIDMRQPGIEVRPLREMTGRAVFNEVFLTDAVVSNDDVIGDVNDGWRVTNTTLNNERSGLGNTAERGGGRLDIPYHTLDASVADILAASEEQLDADRLPRGHHLLDHLVRQLDRTDEPLVRDRVAIETVAGEVSRLSGTRIRAMADDARRRGERVSPSPLVSVQKMAASKNLHSLGRALLDVEGAHGMLADPDALIDDRAMETIATAFMISIGGGTDQIQRNIVGERVLGLPGEPRVDKDVPFKDLPT